MNPMEFDLSPKKLGPGPVRLHEAATNTFLLARTEGLTLGFELQRKVFDKLPLNLSGADRDVHARSIAAMVDARHPVASLLNAETAWLGAIPATWTHMYFAGRAVYRRSGAPTNQFGERNVSGAEAALWHSSQLDLMACMSAACSRILGTASENALGIRSAQVFLYEHWLTWNPEPLDNLTPENEERLLTIVDQTAICLSSSPNEDEARRGRQLYRQLAKLR